MPKTPTGTLTRKTSRQSISDTSPPTTSPMKDPAMPATMLMPSAMPRSSCGKASVRIAVELAISRAPPIPCTMRPKISSSAPADPVLGTTDSPIEAIVNTRNPALYIRTRPNMSPMRPKVTTSTAVTTRNPMRSHSR